MQSSDPASLSRLHDIVVPEPIPFWPPAPGWYAVLGVAAVALVVLALRRALRWRRDAYRREAVVELQRLAGERDWVQVPEIMKRTALAAFSRARVASLTGDDWLAFLDRTGGTTEFTDGSGRRLSTLAHDPRAMDVVSEGDARRTVEVCVAWVRSHSVSRLESAP